MLTYLYIVMCDGDPISAFFDKAAMRKFLYSCRRYEPDREFRVCELQGNFDVTQISDPGAGCSR